MEVLVARSEYASRSPRDAIATPPSPTAAAMLSGNGEEPLRGENLYSAAARMNFVYSNSPSGIHRNCVLQQEEAWSMTVRGANGFQFPATGERTMLADVPTH